MKATEQYYTVVLVIMLYKGGSNFWVCGWNPSVWPFKWKVTEQFFPVVLFIMHHLIHLKINKIFFLFMPYLFYIQVSHYTFAMCSYREKQAEPTEMMELVGYTVDYCEAINGT